MTRKVTFKAVLAAIAVALLAVTGCSVVPRDEAGSGAGFGGDGKFNVVTSFSVLEDMTRQIGGEHVNVYNLVPVGQDPHEYELRPADTTHAQDADLLISSGMNLEGGNDGWISRLMTAVDLDTSQHVEATRGIKPLYISDGVEQDEADGDQASDLDEDEVNPHVFVDPANGAKMAENIAEALIRADPEHAAEYRANRDAYVGRINELAGSYDELFAGVAERDRIIVTSERAFQYLAKRYGLAEGYIWLIDTEDAGSPEQLKRAVDFVREHRPRALFVETNVNQRPMETVSEETGVPIAGTLYSDELGAPGTPAGTYIGFLEHNLESLTRGLGEQ
ncbi:zinc ABC transporter substrate-binding protein [Pseudoglutamicibacter cumminsii]|uniref:Zinc ABC transporter substrate-binding protein n=1 Tax=Pseudoglutamicibacter cumminsii TaxID=156979 RepID=A0ABX5L4U8_9MICC|nr:zinc ABC transporter substrate-binding protein [Pseudoglutamicibacter cumminsii]